MSMDRDQEFVKLLAIPLDEISKEEMEQLRHFAEQQDWVSVRNQLIHYSERFKENQEKEQSRE